MRVSGIVVAFRAPYVTRRVPGEFLAMSNYFAVDSHGFTCLLHPRFPISSSAWRAFTGPLFYNPIEPPQGLMNDS